MNPKASTDFARPMIASDMVHDGASKRHMRYEMGAGELHLSHPGDMACCTALQNRRVLR